MLDSWPAPVDLSPSIALLAAVFATSLLSGVFGMAGGILLMGAFTALLPVSAAMITHGSVQLIANGWRAILHRKHLRWRTIGVYMFGSGAVALALTLVSYAPSKAVLYLLLGLVPILVWVPERWIKLDAARTGHGVAAGIVVTGCNLVAGAAGPLLDIFFVRTTLTRHEIVATKAATQVFSHLAKITVYGLPLMAAKRSAGLPPTSFFLWMVPMSMLGGWAGGIILDRMSDRGFKNSTRWLLTAIGISYLVNAARLFAAGPS